MTSLKIDRLETDIENLKNTITSLEQSNSKLKDELNLFKLYSPDTTRQVYKIRELEEANFDLKTIIGRKELDFKFEKRAIETKYNNDLNKLKDEISLINHKYDAMMRYELYITKIEEYNKELQKKIDDMGVQYEIGMKHEEMKYKINLNQVQQKTLNILGESKKNIQSNALKNLNNSYKLIMLQVNELHNQLAEQSIMMEDLLRTMAKKDKIIHSLKINISVYKEVEKMIITQNRRLSKLFKSLLEEKRQFGEKEYNQVSKKFLRILKNEDDENENENENAENAENANAKNYAINDNQEFDNENPNKILFRKGYEYYNNKNLQDKSPSSLNYNNYQNFYNCEKEKNYEGDIINSASKNKSSNLFVFNSFNNSNSKNANNNDNTRNKSKKNKLFSYNSSTNDEMNSTMEQKSFKKFQKENQFESDISKSNNMNMKGGMEMGFKNVNSTSFNFFKIPKNLSALEVKDKIPKEKKDKIFKESEFNRNNQILDEYSKTLTKSMKFLAVD